MPYKFIEREVTEGKPLRTRNVLILEISQGTDVITKKEFRATEKDKEKHKKLYEEFLKERDKADYETFLSGKDSGLREEFKKSHKSRPEPEFITYEQMERKARIDSGHEAEIGLDEQAKKQRAVSEAPPKNLKVETHPAETAVTGKREGGKEEEVSHEHKDKGHKK